MSNSNINRLYENASAAKQITIIIIHLPHGLIPIILDSRHFSYLGVHLNNFGSTVGYVEISLSCLLFVNGLSDNAISGINVGILPAEKNLSNPFGIYVHINSPRNSYKNDYYFCIISRQKHVVITPCK